MSSLKSRIGQLEKEYQFQRWFMFSRFLEGLTDEQLEDIELYWRFPEPLPEPLPRGASRLDSLERKRLLKLWEAEERAIARGITEMKGRSADELKYEMEHEHWPEQLCGPRNCRKQRMQSLEIRLED
jgi:hypothetical protein